MRSRRSLLRTIGGTALGTGALGMIANPVANAAAARELTHFGTEGTALEFDELGTLGHMVSTVTGFDSFQGDVAKPEFTALVTIPLNYNISYPHGGGSGITELSKASIHVEPAYVPDSNYPGEFETSGIEPYQEGSDQQRGDKSDGAVSWGLDLVWQNTVNRVSPVKLPSPFGVSDASANITQADWNNEDDAAVTATWNGSWVQQYVAQSPETVILGMDFEIDFRRGGDDKGAVNGTYMYNITFEAEVDNEARSRTLPETFSNTHRLEFRVGEFQCAPGDPFCYSNVMN